MLEVPLRATLLSVCSLVLLFPACGGGTGNSSNADSGAHDASTSDMRQADTAVAMDTRPPSDTAIATCATAHGGCDSLVTCTDGANGPTCGACPSGYTGTGTAGCEDIDECATDNGGCDSLVTCTNTPGARTCGTCPLGYSGTGATTCVDIDECATNNGGCDPVAPCTNTAGSFTCGNCPSGYTGGGASGCVDIDECATDNGGCDALTTCTNTPGSRTCTACPSGYSGTGETGCVDIDECATNNGGCDPLTACTNTPGGNTCGACPSGYTGTGAAGCTNIDDCSPQPCLNGGTCTDGVNSYTCVCTGGYTGMRCGTAPQSVSILLHCDPSSQVLNTFAGSGCFGPVAPGGASYAILGPDTPSVTIWSGADCTGCSYVVTSDTNFCSFGFAGGCGGLNDNVQSVSIP
jgi:hypothetical protein